MNKTTEQKKREMKDALSESVERYFADFEALRASGSMDINEIERIWGEGLRRTEGIFAATTTALSSEEVDSEESKKNVVSAAVED